MPIQTKDPLRAIIEMVKNPGQYWKTSGDNNLYFYDADTGSSICRTDRHMLSFPTLEEFLNLGEYTQTDEYRRGSGPSYYYLIETKATDSDVWSWEDSEVHGPYHTYQVAKEAAKDHCRKFYCSEGTYYLAIMKDVTAISVDVTKTPFGGSA